MSEKIRAIKFEHFRGLPNNEFKLKGKSLVLLGANGKGKSSIVDGLEFLFSGQIGRFNGVGTGNIDHDDSIRHVKKGGATQVRANLFPSNDSISRPLYGEVTVTDTPVAKSYFQQHEGVDAYILRRAKILNFVCDQDSDRYKKFVDLLGMHKVDQLQRAFNDAMGQAQASSTRATTTLATKLAPFNDPKAGFSPNKLEQIFDHVSPALESFELQKVECWDDVSSRLEELKNLRPKANHEKIDALTRALVSIESPLSLPTLEDVTTANDLCVKLQELGKSSLDAPRNRVIEEGQTYLSRHAGQTMCPLCEAEFQNPVEVVLERLKERGDALNELRKVGLKHKTVLDRLKNNAASVATQLKKDLEHEGQLASATKQAIRDARASALRYNRAVKRKILTSAGKGGIALPERLQGIDAIRHDLAEVLKKEKEAIVTQDTTTLEAAITLLERSVSSHQEISNAEDNAAKAAKVLRRATRAKNVFSSARESAIQSVFDEIAETVLIFYKRLHDFGDSGDESECTSLKLTSTSRAASGGLRLAIHFLGLANDKDPRAFLSEGHLDSLGLSIFLASVRIFNKPGSLLVLDDVLTSIDKEHRRRVGELLLEEFGDLQIILTTHDEHWHDQLLSSTGARGVSDQWIFRKLKGWTVETGPTASELDGSWAFIDGNLTEDSYRELGGSLRLVLEDFLKRTAAKMEVKVRFKYDGKYTSGDFVYAGLQNQIRDKLIESSPDDDAAIRTDVAKVFGQGDFINFLSHDNPGRLEVTHDQARDFVQGLRSLTQRCTDKGLIRGR